MGLVDRTRAETILRSAGWLVALPESFRSEVLRQALLLDFAQGDVIY
jgi:hypothetical protein